jgi:type 1 fimbria pilin
MRRSIIAVALAVSGLSGAGLLVAGSAHADGACVTAHVNINGSDVVNQTQCTPDAPALP